MAIKYLALLACFMGMTPSAWGAGGGKERGDWHINNQTDTQVIVAIAKADGSRCLSSYIDPRHRLGLPAKMHNCPFPITVTIMTLKAEQSTSCDVSIGAMTDVIFNGESCSESPES